MLAVLPHYPGTQASQDAFGMKENDYNPTETPSDQTPETEEMIRIPKKRFRNGVILSAVVYTLLLGALFIFTPLLSKLKLPVYGGYISKEVLIDKLVTLDSLEFEVELWKYYNQNILDIMEGKSPEINTDSIKRAAYQAKGKSVQANMFDTLLRQRIAAGKAYEAKYAIHSYNLYPPAPGGIISKFNPENSMYGIMIRQTNLTPVLAIGDGTVIGSYWNSDTGNVLIIQHSDNMLSLYGMLSQTGKKVGDTVSTGEVIGYIGGNPDEAETAPGNYKLYFELWHNGNRVDPENYILF